MDAHLLLVAGSVRRGVGRATTAAVVVGRSIAVRVVVRTIYRKLSESIRQNSKGTV